MKSRSTLLPALLCLPLIHFACQPGGSRLNIPSSFPMKYRVGEVDARFGISRERFLTLVREAEAKWEEPLGVSLFEHDPTSDFLVNLTFDHRQQRTIDARQAKAVLDDRENSVRSMMSEYNMAGEEHLRLKARYESELAAFTGRLDRHNATVADWNRKGGAPPEEFAKLKEEEKRVDEARQSLDKLMADLNDAVSRQNALAVKVNSLADQFNLDVNLYNGRFVESREFEQGQYDGKGITVYQFTEESDLRVALMHEFGHALGFHHVDTPEAIMHRRLEKQEMQNPGLTEDDLELLKSAFGT
ncbi:MAG: matrixin family metalloprotease [Bacteroidota bacterium]